MPKARRGWEPRSEMCVSSHTVSQGPLDALLLYELRGLLMTLEPDELSEQFSFSLNVSLESSISFLALMRTFFMPK